MWKFRQVFETQNFERAEAVLNSKYSPHRMIALDNETRFRVFHGFSDVGGLSLHGLSYGPDMRAVTEPFKTYYLLTRVTRGRYRIQTGAQELILRPGQTA